MSTSTEAVVIGRRFQKVGSYHFNHQIKCVAPQGTEAVAVHCTEGSEHITSVYTLTAHSTSQIRASTEKTVQRFLYVKKYRVYVMFCGDLSLRVFSDTFQHMQTIPTTSTALCMEFVEATSTLYIGQSGFIKSWHLVHQLYSPIEPESESTVSVGKDEWVVGLDYEVETGRLAAATEKKVILIDKNIHQEIATYTGNCKDSITGAVLFSSFGYLVLAFRNGLIEVLNTALNSLVGELSGHFKTVTALRRHVTGSSLISCSLDGTVRVWSLETLIECNRLDLGMELLGLSVNNCGGGGGGETAQLLVHSHQDISMWQLSQLESHFASMFSNTVALSRVESPDETRIMATAEDGSVRLLSPVTGEIITTFFPIFTANMLSDVVYCPLGRLLFALLETGDVLAVSALTNPCSTLQLWTSQHSREKIDTISTCVVEWKGRTHSLVFGGSLCGHILLLHSSLFAMELPCPAHGGRVTKLVSSASPMELSTPSSSLTPSLLSLGSDSFLNAWSIGVNRKGESVELKMLICIQMESVPVQLHLLGTLLCVATLRNTVKMVDLSPELMTAHQNHYLPNGHLFHTLPVLSHQREDRHTATITSLSCCPQLCLFATTSLDGLVKIWSASNQLVAEIDFGESLLSVCFSNSQGDLLVGFQRQVCCVSSSHYLPSSYLSLNHCSSSLIAERPIPFDSSLQFWYDPERVPSYPIQLEERRKHCCLLDDYYTSQSPSKAQQQQEESTGEVNVAERKRLPSSPSEAVRVELIRRSSHHLLASVLDVPTGIPPQNSSLSSLKEAIMSSLGAMRSQELARALLVDKRSSQSPQIKRPVAPARKFPAKVTPLQTPFSPSLPIAPDCLVPNSTLRQTIGYVPAPDPLALLDQSTIDKILANSSDSTPDLDRLRGKKMKKRRRRRKRMVDGAVSDAGSRGEEVVSESGESLSESESQSEAKSDNFLDGRDEISEDGVKSLDVAPSSSDSTHHLCDDSIERCEDRSSPEDPVSVVDSTQKVDTPPGKVEGEAKLSRQPETQPSPQPDTERGNSVVESSEVAQNSPLLKRDEPTIPAVVETKVVPTVTIPFHTGPSGTTTATKTPTATPARATHSSGGCVATSGAEIAITAHREAAADVEDILQKVMRIARFSSSLCQSITMVQGVCDEMVSMLKCGGAESMKNISSAIVELKKEPGLTEAQQSAIAQVLVTRLQTSASNPAMTATSLLCLERLVTTADDITLLTVLPFLLDSNVGVRKAAFSALQAISGITSRSELHCRLIEIGILQHIESDEDEILRALSRRLESRESDTHEPLSLGVRETGATGKYPRERRNDRSGDRKKNTANKREELENKAKNKKEKVIIQRKMENKNKPKENGGEDWGRPSHIQRVSTAHLTSREGEFSSNSSSKRQSKRSINSLVSRANDMAMFQDRLRQQPILHTITTTAADRALRRGNQPGARPLPPISGRGGRREARNLWRLLARQPTQFSQSHPVREVMRGAYPITRVGADEKDNDFRWTEVFPVLKKRVDSKGSATGDGQRGDCGKDEDTKGFKLPKITDMIN